MDVNKDTEKWNPLTPLMGMETGAATLQSSMEVPQKVKNRTTLQPSNHTTSIIPKDATIVIRRGTCTVMFLEHYEQ